MQRMEIINLKICYASKTEIKTSSIKDVESIFCFLLIENGWVSFITWYTKSTVQLLCKILNR